jgi:Fe-S-cluster containining protein
MVKYREKYILEGLDEIPPGMMADLDLAYDVCMHLHNTSECEMCGKCCHQPNITIMDGEAERIAEHLNIGTDEFIRNFLYRKDERWLFKKSGRCRFLGKDNKCTIWKERPQICHDFPYLVSKFMSRVYLSIVNDIDIDLSYMEDDWPCTAIIQNSIDGLILKARKEREKRITRSL